MFAWHVRFAMWKSSDVEFPHINVVFFRRIVISKAIKHQYWYSQNWTYENFLKWGGYPQIIQNCVLSMEKNNQLWYPYSRKQNPLVLLTWYLIMTIKQINNPSTFLDTLFSPYPLATRWTAAQYMSIWAYELIPLTWALNADVWEVKMGHASPVGRAEQVCMWVYR
jgi:hypothetical protein